MGISWDRLRLRGHRLSIQTTLRTSLAEVPVPAPCRESQGLSCGPLPGRKQPMGASRDNFSTFTEPVT